MSAAEGNRKNAPRTAALPPLVRAMLRPEFYPDRPAHVELIQTHISYVFVAGDYVYKIKKPIRFAFADCSTLAARYHFCREEVRLNRRLAPNVYLAVVPIAGDRHGFALAEEGRGFDPEVVEYAVKMRRLPEDRMLDRLLHAGKVDSALIDALAARLAAFHGDASTAQGWWCGSAAAIWRSVLGNAAEFQRFAGYTLSASRSAAIEDYLKGFIAAHWKLLNDRAHQGRVREGHGDLRCEHVCMSDGIEIFDCIEFSERLRYGDVAADLAFLAMDFDALGAERLGDRFVESYRRESNDGALPTLVNFYKCHYACVRGKVESLKSLEDEVPPAERERARDRARESFALAARYAARGRPALLVVCGLAGTGKSTLARMLQIRTGFELIASDRTRKRLAGIKETARAGAAYGAGIYSAEFDRLTYDTALGEAYDFMRDGCGVILDATFKLPQYRRTALAVGAQLGVPVLFVECRADQELVLHRLAERTAAGQNVSDATADVYRHQRAEFVPLSELSARNRVAVDTGGDKAAALETVETALGGLFVPSENVAHAHGC
jgi:uncharacterized protein